MRGLRWLAVLLVSWPGFAHADRVHLVSGAVIEGKASRYGDKVVVEVESGELALSADAVQRIESGTSDVQRAEAMFAKLAASDVAGLLQYANFCRDHGMAGREQMALQHVLELAPDHASTRARLGYVRADAGWIKREDHLRAQGMVEYEGKWIARAEMLQIERLRAETETARHERDKAMAEAEKAELEAEQARRSARAKQSAEAPAPVATPAATYATGYAYPGRSGSYVARAARMPCTRLHRGVCIDDQPPPSTPRSTRAAFPIAGVKDPFDYFR